MSQKNTGLIIAIIFAAISVSGSLLFFALQIKASTNTSLAANVAATSDDQLQQKIDDGINNYIKKQQATQAQGKEGKAVTLKPVSNEDHVYGNKNAEISLIEYSDFECPFCKLFNKTPKQIVDASNGKVNWVYRHFPLDKHINAQKEAEASECANELGGNDKFWKFEEKIFERTTSNGTGFALADLVPLAKELGLDQNKFKTCLDSGKYAKHVQQDMADGDAAGVTGTPGNILVNHKTQATKLIQGAQPLDLIQTAIDTLTEKSS